MGGFEVEEIQVGDVVQVDPSAGSDFARCYCRVVAVAAIALRVLVPRGPGGRGTIGLVLRDRVQRIGRATWDVGP